MLHFATSIFALEECFPIVSILMYSSLSQKLLLTAAIGLLPASAAAQFPYSGELLYRVYGGEHWNLKKARVVGDVDGDGCEDFLAGSSGNEFTDRTGHVWLISGADGSVIRQHDGFAPNNYFGRDFTGMGDLNADGVADYAICAPGAKRLDDTGAVMIYDGATGVLLREYRDPFTISRFGDAIAGGRDVTGDGFPDMVVMGAKSKVIKVYDGSQLLTSLLPDLTIVTGVWPGNNSERPLTLLDDVDGDGIGDIAYSANERSYVYSSGTGNLLFSGYGGYAANLGDISNDGISEFIFGYPGNGEYFRAGSAYVYSGADYSQLYYVYGDALATDNWSMGASVAVVGDLTGDGKNDFVMGAPGDGDPSASGSGLWFINGADGTILAEVRAEGFIQGYSFFGNPFVGSDVEAADVDGDGQKEILVGASHVHHNLGGGVVDVRSGVILVGKIL